MFKAKVPRVASSIWFHTFVVRANNRSHMFLIWGELGTRMRGNAPCGKSGEFAKANGCKRAAGIAAVLEALECGDLKVAEKYGIQFAGPRSARPEDLPSLY